MRFLLFFLMLVVLPSVSAVVINEVMYNPSNEQGIDADMEWVELHSEEEVNLSNYYLDGKKLNGSFIGYGIVAKDKAKFLAAYGSLGCMIMQTVIFLTNEKDVINLSNLVVEDIVAYSSTLGGNGNGKTLERVNNSNEFKESLVAGGTPCRENSIAVQQGQQGTQPVPPPFNIPPSSPLQPTNTPQQDSQSTNTPQTIPLPDYGSLKIIGLMPNPGGDDNALMPDGEWIELYNSGNQAVNLTGLLFYDHSGRVLRPLENNSESLLLGPFTSAKIYRNGDTRFSLNNDAEEITLEDAYDRVIDKAVYSSSKEDRVLRKVNDAWISEEKPKAEQVKKTGSSSKSGKKSKSNKVSVIAAPKTSSKKPAQSVKITSSTTTTTIQKISLPIQSGVVYESNDVKAGNSGVYFFGFSLILLVVVLMFKKDF